MAVLEFTTEPVESRELKDVEFTLDGENYRASAPAPFFFERLVAAHASGNNYERVYWLLKFADESIDPAHRMRIEERMKDPSDPLQQTSQLIPMMMGVLEEWQIDTSEWEETEEPVAANRAGRRAVKKPGKAVARKRG